MIGLMHVWDRCPVVKKRAITVWFPVRLFYRTARGICTRACAVIIVASLMTACTAAPASATVTPLPTPTLASAPTHTPTHAPTHAPEVLCADMERAWAAVDWQTVIDNLELVAKASGQCGGQDVALKLYPAWYNYGAALDTKGDRDGAIHAWQQALLYNPTGAEAASALRSRAALTPPPLASCGPAQVQAAFDALPAYTPAKTEPFIALRDGAFVQGEQPFVLRGVNYYPALAPWRRFLTDSTPQSMEKELDLISGAGFNTIRIFLWYEALFDCPANGPVPNVRAFATLDTALRLAALRKLNVIVTLNDLPDLTFRPLYTEPHLPAQQTAYIINRYRDEAAILAWDLRNEGDIDYMRGLARGRDVIDWLKNTASLVRALDPKHLITAGWNDDAATTRNAVDFISFHHWSQPEYLAWRVAAIRALADKPILLEEVGYSTRATGEAAQADFIKRALQVATDHKLLGWVVWTAFDFTPEVTCIAHACPGKDNAEHHFGLWRVDYSPKPAVEAVRAAP